jgi:hypothetical protein
MAAQSNAFTSASMRVFEVMAAKSVSDCPQFERNRRALQPAICSRRGTDPYYQLLSNS